MIANPTPWPDWGALRGRDDWDMDADSAFNWSNRESRTLVAAQSWTRYDRLIAIPRLVEQFRRSAT